MMRQNFTLLVILTWIISCNNNNQTSKTSKHSDKVYQTIDIDCRTFDNTAEVDTTFLDNISFKITLRCSDKISFIDTIKSEGDTFLIHNWHDIYYVVKSNLFNGPLIIDKDSFKDSLALDLVSNGFLSSPLSLQFNAFDTSIIFKTFIARADSDVGDIYVMQVNKEGKSKVIGVEDPAMEVSD